MKTVVVTGSARGFGYEFVRLFRERDYNVVVCDISKTALKEAENNLLEISSRGKVLTYEVDITNEEMVSDMIASVLKEVKTIDIWINNAGVNQPDKAIWELDKKVIDRLVDIDLKATILCSKLIMPVMIKQKSGQIYNVEGYGSNDAKKLGLSIYGTSKRAITYFTEALAKESEEKNTGVLIGKLSPGIMITDFITNALGNKEKINLSEKTKKVYNILGDYPDVVAEYLVTEILDNTQNDAKIEWLTNRKAAWRFMTSAFNKRDFFKER